MLRFGKDLKSLYFFGVASLVACSGGTTGFTGSAQKVRVLSQSTAGTDASRSASKENSGNAVAVVAKKQHSDTFLMSDVVSDVQQVSVPMEPGAQTACVQSIGNQSCQSLVVNPATNKTVSPIRQAPVAKNSSHNFTSDGKNVALYVLVDNQRTFVTSGAVSDANGIATYPGRQLIKQGINRLVSNLSNMNWTLFYSSFVDSQGKVGSFPAITKGATPEAIASALESNIFANPQNGESRVFRSLSQLALQNAWKDDWRSVHVLTSMTSSRNCRDNNNNFAICGSPIPANSPDNYTYLAQSASYPALQTRPMSLYGAWHQQSSNSATSSWCGVTEQVEPAPSQFSQLANLFNVSISGAPSIVYTGDICASTPDVAWIDNLSNDAKYFATYRYMLNDVPAAYTDYPQYRMSIMQNNANVSASNYSFVAGSNGQLLSFNNSMSGKVDITYFSRPASFDQTVFAVLSGAPVPGSVSISYNYGGASGSLPCVSANSFAGQPSNVLCRYDGGIVYLLKADSIPLPTPQNGDQTLTIKYQLTADSISVVKKNASSAIVAPETIAFSGTVLGGGSVLQPSSVVANGASLTLSFGGNLLPGNYQVCYNESLNIGKTCSLSSYASASSPSLKCSFLGTNAQATELPCKLADDRKTVTYDGLIPLDASGKRNFVASYNASLDSVSSLTLNAPPLPSSVAVKLEHLDGTAIRTFETPADYVLQGAVVNFVNAIAPGQVAKASYKFVPTVSGVMGNCFPLSSSVVNVSTVSVKYGQKGSEALLDKDGYTVTPASDAANQRTLVCVPVSLLVAGADLIVEYTE